VLLSLHILNARVLENTDHRIVRKRKRRIEGIDTNRRVIAVKAKERIGKSVIRTRTEINIEEIKKRTKITRKEGMKVINQFLLRECYSQRYRKRRKQ
jgi:hypothetical protein